MDDDAVILKRDTTSRYPPAGLYFVVGTHGFVPWVIRRGTHSRYDHAGIVVDHDGGTVEAEPGGVRRGHLDDYDGCRLALNIDEDTTVDQRRSVAAAAVSMLGTPYNDLDIVECGLEALGWHWRWLAKLAAGDHELICSQLVAQAGTAAGLDWRCGQPDPCQVTPAMLARRPGVRARDPLSGGR